VEEAIWLKEFGKRLAREALEQALGPSAQQ
jgi:hypothetical protein